MFTGIFEILNNREIATAFWLIVFALFFLGLKGVRKSFGQLISAFFSWKIHLTIFISAISSFIVILILHKINFWGSLMIKDTIFWFCFTALLMIYKSISESGNDKIFRILIIENIKVIAIIEFIVNLHEFSLLFEMIFIPTIILISTVEAIIETQKDNTMNIALSSWIFLIVAIISLVLTIGDVRSNTQEYVNYHTLKSFLLPIILTVLFIPCTYLLALFSRYEGVLLRVRLNLDNKDLRSFAKRRLFVKANLNIRKLNKLSHQVNYFYVSMDKDEIRNLIQ